jgi:hypothetical protein
VLVAEPVGVEGSIHNPQVNGTACHTGSWLAAGAPVEGIDDCRARFRRVADLLPVEPGGGLALVTRRLEAVAVRLEGGA